MSANQTVDRDRWVLIEQVLDEVFDLDEGSDQKAVVRRLCAGDDELRRQVDELLAASQRSGGILDRTVDRFSPQLVADFESYLSKEDSSAIAGRRIGPYRLVEILGRGGMGVVYLAERADEQYRQQVAIKLIPRGLETAEMKRRFLVERQILADLEHANIARLLDGGVTDEGYPYLVMEFIDGEPIDEYCRRNELALKERLRLFVTACAAVQHAHQKLVIHRDLKPSNILVTDQGDVKLLDFGVAKLADPSLSPSGSQTVFQPRTPGYASPEQIANLPVSTASDIYSMGVILYRILTGRSPLETEGLSPTEAQAVVGEQPPELPSAAVSAAGRSLNGASEVPFSIEARHLRGDLDNILLKTLEKRPEDRYATLDQLVEDIRRHFEGLPVRAHSASRAYRAAKFAGRHRVALATTTLIILAIAVAVSGVVWQAGRARTEALRAQRVAELLTGLFTDANPYAGQDREMTVLELIDRGRERVDDELVDDPELAASLNGVLGQAYAGQGQYDSALALHQAALERRRGLYGDRDPRVAESALNVAVTLMGKGEYEEARPYLETSLKIYTSEVGSESREVSDVLTQFGNLESSFGDYSKARQFHQEALRIQAMTSPKPNLETAKKLRELSVALEQLGHADDSQAILEDALDLATRTAGEDHPTTAAMRNDLALQMHARGLYESSEKLYRQALDVQQAKLGVDHLGTADAANNLGKLLMDKGEYEAAEEFVERAVELNRRYLGKGHFSRIASELNLATLRRETGSYQEADGLYRDCLSRLRDLVGEEHYAVGRVLSHMAMNDQARGELDRARVTFEKALEMQREFSVREFHLAETLLGLGAVRGDQGDLVEAEKLLREALEIFEPAMPPGNWQVAEVRMELGAVLLHQGRIDEAMEFLEPGIDILMASRSPEDRRVDRAIRYKTEIEAVLADS